jgi:hypothetical protein
LPDDVPLPVDLDDLVIEQRTVGDRRVAHVLVREDQRGAPVRQRLLAWRVLSPEARLTLSAAAKDLSPRQQLVGEALQPLPELHFAPAHVDEQCARARRLKDRVAAPGTLRIVDRDAGRIHTRIAHAEYLAEDPGPIALSLSILMY